MTKTMHFENLLQKLKSKCSKTVNIVFYNRRIGLGYISDQPSEIRQIANKIVKKNIHNKQSIIFNDSSSTEIKRFI